MDDLGYESPLRIEYDRLRYRLHGEGWTMKSLSIRFGISHRELRKAMLSLAEKKASSKIAAFRELDELTDLHRKAQKRLRKRFRLPEGYLKGSW